MNFEFVNADFLMWVVGNMVMGAAIYGGIRADIKHVLARQESNEAAIQDVHKRVDRLLEIPFNRK